MEYAIPFTQFLRPNGHRMEVEFMCPDKAVYDKSLQIMAAGLTFECEVLSDNATVSFTISGYHPEMDEEADLSHRLSPNGPKVPEVLKDMILGFDVEDYKKRCEAAKAD